MCRWHIATAVDPSRSEGESLTLRQKNETVRNELPQIMRTAQKTPYVGL